MVAGAAIGVACGLIAGRWANQWVTTEVLRIEQQHPSWFYAGMFLVTYEFASQFDDVRRLMHGSLAVLHATGYRSAGLIAALAVVGVGFLTVLLGAVGVLLYRRHGRHA